jgi:hypothetical protein
MEFCGFDSPSKMSRKKKGPIQLRTVDEDKPTEPKPDVLRLEQRGEMAKVIEDPVPLRLGRAQDDDKPNRLFLPERSEVDVRSHEPGIEHLLDEAHVSESAEAMWGGGAARKNPIPWGWFALIAIAILAALAWSLTRVHDSQAVAGSIREQAESVITQEKQDEAEAIELIQGIESTMEAFFSASDVDEWKDIIRHPERVMPLARDHYSKHPGLPGPMRSAHMLQPLMIEVSGNFWIATALFADGSRHGVILEVDEKGVPRVDWETLVCHQPMPWNRFATDRPRGQSMDFRVYAEPDNFYSHEFSDANQWMSLRLTALDADQPLFGYIRRNHEDWPAIMGHLENNGNRKAAFILRLIIPDGLQSPRGVIIEKLISPRWLLTESASTDS